MTSQKSFQQLTMEKEQALADLNSVERSLSALFRRYENLKGVLEGFKKVVCPFLSLSWLVLDHHTEEVKSLLTGVQGLLALYHLFL